MPVRVCVALVVIAIVTSFAGNSVFGQAAAAAGGPLRVLAANPRYFTHDGKSAVLLVGSHTWNNLVDMTAGDYT